MNMGNNDKPKLPRIRMVTLDTAGVFGPTSEVLTHLYVGGFISSAPYRVFFDADPRFLRVECDAGTVHLVPLTNVGSITLGDEKAVA